MKVWRKQIQFKTIPCLHFNINIYFQLSANCYNPGNIEIGNKKIKYDKITTSDLDVQTSDLFNSAHSAVSKYSKKR